MRSEEELDTADPERKKDLINPVEEQCTEKPAQAERKRRKCRDMLAESRNLTYLIQEIVALNMLEEHLHRILALAEKFVPSDEGLKLEGPSTLLPCKRSKQGGKTRGKKKMRTNLPFKELSKRIKRKQKFSGRHGSRVTTMRHNF